MLKQAILTLAVIQSSVAHRQYDEMCRDTETYAQRPDAQVISNGCTKPDFIQVNGEEDFSYCCDRHDACYSMCGAPKAFCDDDFKKCMLRLCETKYKKNKQCSSAAETYAMGTMMFGQEGYHDTQRDVCTCIEIANLRDHYSSLISSFYKKYNPEEERSSDEIMDSFFSKHKQVKASEPAYMYSRLYYALHKKYDDAIIRKKSRQKTEL